MCYIPLARKTSAAAKLALYGRTDQRNASTASPQSKRFAATAVSKRFTAMLRREPTRIEMKSEDLEEFDRFQAQQKKAAKAEEAGAPESKQDDARKAAREDRIGLRSDSY